MRHARATLVWCLAGAVAVNGACSKSDAPPVTTGATTDAAPAATGEWPASLGSLLVVPSDTEDLAVVLYPVGTDAAALAAARLALLSPSGDTIRARSTASAADSLHCGDAAVVRLSRGTALTWSVGLQSREARPVRSDSMDQLSDRDSTFYAAEMSRLASAVASDQTSRFTGLPFALTALRRLRVAGREIVAGQLVRRVNQEASPAEEHTLVVAERDGTKPGAGFITVHSDRSEGSEDTAEHFDVMAALRVGGSVFLLVSRDRPSGSTYEILERSDTGGWRQRWSRTISC